MAAGVVVATVRALVLELISDLIARHIMVLVPAVALAAVTFGASPRDRDLLADHADRDHGCARDAAGRTARLVPGRLAGRTRGMGAGMRRGGRESGDGQVECHERLRR